MNDLKHTEQQTHSPETLAELNPQQLLQRIQAAETAIFCRLQGMRISSIELVEGQAIQDALDGLVRLTKETLEFADSLVEVTSHRRQSLGLGLRETPSILARRRPSCPPHGFRPTDRVPSLYTFNGGFVRSEMERVRSSSHLVGRLRAREILVLGVPSHAITSEPV